MVKDQNKRTWKVLRRLTLLLTVFSVLVLFIVAKVIPPIVGRVVDAKSGEPIRNIEIAFHINCYCDGTRTNLIATRTTGRFGWFFFPGALRLRGFPLADYQAHWLTVNAEVAPSGSQASAEGEVLYRPTFGRPDWPRNDKYFPLAVSPDWQGCARVWTPTCMYRSFWWFVSIPVIPVLDDVEACEKIKNASLRENCRRLNTYRAAFGHVGSIEELEKGRRTCNEVDHNDISRTCLNELATYAANPQIQDPVYYGRSVKP